MKIAITLTAFGLFGVTASAQLTTLPPSSLMDGVSVQMLGGNAGSTNWNAMPGLGSYGYTTQATAPSFSWPEYGYSNSSVLSNLAEINASGGVVRAIFVGGSAGWQDSFGYSYSGNPSGSQSFTAFNSIVAGGPGANTFFGDHIDVSLSAGQASTFDFWLNAPGGFAGSPNPTPSTYGGIYTAFHPAHSWPINNPGNVKFAQTPLMVNTALSASVRQDVSTYLMTFEDWNLANSIPGVINYADVTVALQFFHSDGTPFAPVPEPSTYALFGALSLLGIVAYRKAARK